jgi:hypothetical protein
MKTYAVRFRTGSHSPVLIKAEPEEETTTEPTEINEEVVNENELEKSA